MTVDSRVERWLALSARLTGFSVFELRATGMAIAYLGELDARLSPGLLDDLLACTDDDAMLDDPRLGPVARNLAVLWYCGTWTAMPSAWVGAYGRTDPLADGVVSAAAYLAGLQWTVARAHPPGARQSGFGAWGLPP
jgi:hypothetical protein